METQVQQAREFFNLHVSGIGYLNRVRWVDLKSRAGRKAESFLCCSINALHGATDDPSYTTFDFKVSGEEAIEMVDSLAAAVEQNRKVIVSFKAGDIYAHLYDRKVRDRNGRETGQSEPAALIKGRLILINTVKVDGQLVYQRPRDEEGQSHQDGDDSSATKEQTQQDAPAAREKQSAAQPEPARVARRTGTGLNARSQRPNPAPAPAGNGFDDLDDQIPY